jgi:hypothetical protein
MPACPTCGQALGRDAPDGAIRIPDLTEADEGSDPPGSVPRAEAPTDADVKLSPPTTTERRAFLRAASGSAAVKRDRSGANAAELAAFEAMWPPRDSSERPEHP